MIKGSPWSAKSLPDEGPPIGSRPSAVTDWESFRLAHFDISAVNLNPAMLGCMSAPVKRSIVDALENSAFPLGQYQAARTHLKEIRSLILELWPLDGYEIAIGGGATSFFNALVVCLYHFLKDRHADAAPVRLITSEHEHTGAIAGFEAHPGYEIYRGSALDFQDPRRLDQLLRDSRPHIVLLSQRTFDLYRLLPVAEVNRIVKQRRPDTLVLVDVAQALAIEDIGPHGDILVGSFHKWLFGPHGTGVMWLRSELLSCLEPFHYGERFDSEHRAAGFEATGGQAFSQLPGIVAALELYRAIGLHGIRSRSLELADHLAAQLRSSPYFRVEEQGPVLLLHSRGLDLFPVYGALNRRGFYTKCIKRDQGVHLLRLGIPYYESKSRLMAFAAALEEEIFHVARIH